MAFQIVNFTNAGLITLQQIASSKSLVIDEVIPCSETVSENDVIIQPPAFFETYRNNHVTANVVSAGSDPNGINAARLVVSLQTTSAQSETIKMLIVVAHSVEGGVATAADTFIGALDETGLVVTYNPNIPIKLNVALSFAFDRTATITIGESEANYLLHDEAARFVSTHSTEGPTVGEDQNIYGVKHFMNRAIFDNANGAGEIDFMYQGEPCISISQTNNYGIVFNTMPGADTFDDESVYLFQVDGQDIASIGKNPGGGIIKTESMQSYMVKTDRLAGLSQQEITVASHLKPISGASMGDAVNKWSSVGTDKILTNVIKSADSQDDTITCSSAIKPSLTESFDLGTTNRRWANVYAQTINCNDIIDATGAGSLLRAPGAGGDLKVGSITCVYDKLITLGLNLSGTCGKEITVAANTVHFAVSQVVTLHTLKGTYNNIPVANNAVNLTNYVIDYRVATWSKSQYTIPAGRYVILNNWTDTGLSNESLFIVQRIG